MENLERKHTMECIDTQEDSHDSSKYFIFFKKSKANDCPFSVQKQKFNEKTLNRMTHRAVVPEPKKTFERRFWEWPRHCPAQDANRRNIACPKSGPTRGRCPQRNHPTPTLE
jgi:hypothetical protein